jgi:hypothetical protein
MYLSHITRFDDCEFQIEYKKDKVDKNGVSGELYKQFTLENKTYISLKNNKNFIVVNGISYYEI